MYVHIQRHVGYLGGVAGRELLANMSGRYEHLLPKLSRVPASRTKESGHAEPRDGQRRVTVRISGIPYFVWLRRQGGRVCEMIRLWHTSVNDGPASQQTIYYDEIHPFYTAVDLPSDTLFLAMVLHMRALTANGRMPLRLVRGWPALW